MSKEKKLGEILKYGLNEELSFRLAEMPNLKIAFLTLMFHGFIANQSMGELRMAIVKASQPESWLEIDPFTRGADKSEIHISFFKEFFSKLNSNIKRKIKYSTADEMFKKLDEYPVPEWIENMHKQLFDTLPDLRFVGEKTYLIANNRGLFKNEGIEEPVGNDEIDGDETISLTFNKILGMDEEKTVFAGIEGNSDIYLEYHTKDSLNTEIIRKGHFLGLIEGKKPIVVKDGKLIMVESNNSCRVLKACNPNEKYKVLWNSILVEGKKPTFIKPYEITIDGKEIRYSDSKYREYVLREFLNWIVIYPITETGVNREIKKYSEGVTITNLMENLGKYKGYDQSVKDVLSIFDILKEHIDPTADLTLFLYDFLDLLMHMDRRYWPVKCLPRALNVLRNLEEKDELGDPVADWESFRDSLMEYAYWTEERLAEYHSAEMNIYIGCFIIQDGHLKYLKQRVEEGKLIGNLYVYQSPEKALSGTVVYDIREDKLIIQYHRLLTKPEKDLLVKVFNPGEEEYSVRIYT